MSTLGGFVNARDWELWIVTSDWWIVTCCYVTS